MLLEGYGPQILNGTLETIKLSLLSLLVAFVMGLLGAAAKLFGGLLLRALGNLYTTLVRSVPDLVLMLLLFFSIQMGLNQITDMIGLNMIRIDAFWAGALTIGIIYGAYFAETFRGAFIGVPKGQLEAGKAYGMTSWGVFYRILFPQMMRIALPGIGNNWLVVLKATALVSIIGLSDLVEISQSAGQATGKVFLFIAVAGLIYLALTTVSNIVLYLLERKYSSGVKSTELF
ncbi:ABC transporter permease [Brackiella oedipodis]|uniref:ABC transporter permease n=1 Tax=Brackiella oedipodis TaxID=124225 RepID=UPI00049132AB|nr:ABC transporter permease [Brackiella oedipodis]